MLVISSNSGINTVKSVYSVKKPRTSQSNIDNELSKIEYILDQVINNSIPPMTGIIKCNKVYRIYSEVMTLDEIQRLLLLRAQLYDAATDIERDCGVSPEDVIKLYMDINAPYLRVCDGSTIQDRINALEQLIDYKKRGAGAQNDVIICNWRSNKIL